MNLQRERKKYNKKKNSSYSKYSKRHVRILTNNIVRKKGQVFKNNIKVKKLIKSKKFRLGH